VVDHARVLGLVMPRMRFQQEQRPVVGLRGAGTLVVLVPVAAALVAVLGAFFAIRHASSVLVLGRGRAEWGAVRG